MLNNEITIFDDFLDLEQFNVLQEQIMSMQFPWFYNKHVSMLPEHNNIQDPLAKETDGFHHVFYDKSDNAKSFTFSILNNLFIALEQKLNISTKDMLRIIASMKTPKINFTEQNYNLPHIDYNFPHKSLIYYINDSDGDTRIFNEKFVLTHNGSGIGFRDKFHIRERVTPKSNRLLLIDGLIYHTASNPIEAERRVIININCL